MVTQRKILLAAIATTLAGFALPSFADDYYDVAPPHRRAERMEHREGYVWVPGSYEWRNGRHEWIAGHLVAEKRGYRYAPDRWVMHDNNKWAYQRGGWNQDSDGDGVPDRLDNHPNNPNRK